MASNNQDFVTYAGNAISPIITVRNSAGAVLDIGSVSQITWRVQTNADSAVILSKTKTAGEITFVTDGSDGQFQVAILAVDTTVLAAIGTMFVHSASITDAGGNITTTTIGRMQLGLAPIWTYDPGQIATIPMYAVRDLIGDTKNGDQLLFDAEINAAIAVYSNTYLAAAECCRKIAARFGRDVDIQQGELRTLYSSRRKAYQSLGSELQTLGYARSGIQGYAGGVSQQDKESYVQDQDRVTPQFNIGMQDNFLPIGPVGNEVPGGNNPQGEGTVFP